MSRRHVCWEQAWLDLKQLLERGDIEDKANQTVYVADLQRAMEEIETDNDD